MSSKINQLCKKIAQHPSQINLLNQAIALALDPPSIPDLSSILQLISKLPQEPALIKFISAKLKVIFISLLTIIQTENEERIVRTLSKVYSLSSQKSQLSEQIVSYFCQNNVSWGLGWNAQILAGICEQMIKKVNSNNTKWVKIVEFIINLPQLSQLNLAPINEPEFKKSFQKLLLTVLDSKNCPQEQLKQIYHQLGTKIISKMQQPLALSNICLDIFIHRNQPQLQIQVLSCLFLLVGKYGLELEHFYEKLEQLISYREQSRSVYQLPNSRRFFKLLQASLKSSRVPFKTISKLANIMIGQLPGQTGQFTFWSLSFVVNLTKKHRKLLDQLPLLPQIKALRYHYSSKIRALVSELSKNLNKVDYLDIDQFTKISMQGLAKMKLESALNSLEDDQLQFRLPAFEQSL